MMTFIAALAVTCGALIIWLWPSKIGEEDPWVTIYQTGDQGQIAFIKSLFEDAGIPLLVKGEGVQDLFGMGRLGTGYNFITGPVQIQVPSSKLAEAQDLLGSMETELGHS